MTLATCPRCHKPRVVIFGRTSRARFRTHRDGKNTCPGSQTPPPPNAPLQEA